MKIQLDEKQDLIRKIKRRSSADEIQKVKVFIAGMEAGKEIQIRPPSPADKPP